MKVAVHMTVEVDERRWTEEYGVPRDEVRTDVRSYILGTLANAPVPLVGSLKTAGGYV